MTHTFSKGLMAGFRWWADKGRLVWLSSVLAVLPAVMGLWVASGLHALWSWTAPGHLSAWQGAGLLTAAALVGVCQSSRRIAQWVAGGLGGVLVLAGAWLLVGAAGASASMIGFYIGVTHVLAGVWGFLMGVRRFRWHAQWLVLVLLAFAWLYTLMGLMGRGQGHGVVFLSEPQQDQLHLWNLSTLALGFAMAATLLHRTGLSSLYDRRPDLRLVMFIGVALISTVVTSVSVSLSVAGDWAATQWAHSATGGTPEMLHVAQNPASQQFWLLVMVVAIVGLVWFVTWGLMASIQPLMQQMQEQQRVFNGLPAGVLILDGKGLVQSLNATAAQMWRTTSLQEFMRPFWELFVDRGVATRVVGSDPAPGTIDRTPAQIQRRDGSTSDVALTLMRMPNESGPSNWVLLVQDDTECSRERHRLQAYEAVFALAGVGIAIGDVDRVTIAEVNPAFAAMHGGDVRDFKGKALTEVLAPSERLRLADRVALTHRHGYHEFESTHQRLDGTTFPAKVKARAVESGRGGPVFRVAYVEDITERQHLADQLNDAQHMARLVLATQQDYIVRWQPDAVVLFANDRYARLVGETEDSIVGLSWRLLRPRAQADEEITRQLEGHVQDLLSRPRTLNFEDRVLTEEGQRWVYWSTVPVFNADGTLRAFQSIGHDITARKTAESALALREGWFRGMLDSRHHLTVILDARGQIQAISLHAASLFQRSPKDLVGLVYSDLELFADQPDVRRVLQEGVRAAEAGRTQQAEVDIIDAKGLCRVFDMEFRPISGGGQGWGNHVLLESLEVTDFHRHRRELEEQDIRFKVITDSMPGAVFEFYRVGDAAWLSYANQMYARLFAADASDEGGHSNLLEGLHPEGRVSFLQRMTQSEKTLSEMRWEGRLARDASVWLSIRAVPRGLDGRTVWRGFALDITETKLREQDIERSRSDLRALSVHHETLREDERRRMAREVHDELGQNLTALRMGLSVLSVSSGGGVNVAEEARRLKGLVDSSIKVVRGIATTLRPAAMDMGLGSALAWLAGEFESHTDLRCAMDVDVGGVAFDDATATALFRITQESLTNVARHAQATQVWIRGRHINRHFVLEVVDDGQGFDTNSPARPHGFGLRGMKERVISLDGDLIVHSNPGGGTVVSIHLPVKEGHS